MGSSLGISTAYLASADTGFQCNTMEGSSGIAEIATENFQKLETEQYFHGYRRFERRTY